MKQIKSTRYSKTPFICLLLYSYGSPVADVIYRRDAIWLCCAVYARCPNYFFDLSSSLARNTLFSYMFKAHVFLWPQCVRLNKNTDVMKQDADFITADFLYMFRASCAHHQEYKILTWQPSVRVLMVAGGSSLRHIWDETKLLMAK